MGSLNKCITSSAISPEDRDDLRALTAVYVAQGEDPAEASAMAAQELLNEAQVKHEEVMAQLPEVPGVLAQGAAERGPLGLYSAVEQAVLDMNLPQWKKSKEPALTPEEQSRFDELTRDVTSTADERYSELHVLVEKQRKAQGLVSGNEIWNKLKKTQGVKVEELEWLGLEDYLNSGPKFTRNEVVEFIRDNGVNVEETVAESGEGAAVETIEWNDGDVWDDEEAWQYNTEEMLYEFDRGESDGLFGDIAEWMNRWINEHLDEVRTNYDTSIPDLNEIEDDELLAHIKNRGFNINEDMRQEARDDFREAANEVAQQTYMENPVYIYRATNIADEDLYIFGNDDQGYDVRHGDWRQYQNAVRSDIWSFNEAQLQAEDFAREQELLADEGDESVAKWEEYVTEGDYDNYRELKLTLPDIEDDFYNDVHFPDRNIVAFLRVTDRELNDVNTYFIDEFQSDWHQDGRQKGYSTGLDAGELEVRRSELNTKVNDRLKEIVGGTDSERTTAHNLIRDDLKIEKDDPFKELHEPVLKRIQEINPEEINKIKELIDERDSLTQRIEVERYGVPDAPFKGNNWISLGLKRAIVDAVNSGANSLAWADSNVLSERWSERYSKLYQTQYDIKMPSIVKKLTGQKPVHLNMEGETHTAQELGYWTIPLTDELKAQVREKGFPLFQTEPSKPPRATFKRPDALDPRRIIKLGEQSDLSSFLHESGHLFLDMEAYWAEKYGITENHQNLLDWLGVTSFSDVTKEHHEKFAETYEAYLREGKAPSLKLRDAFAAFARWLNKIYAILTDPRLKRAELGPEIREIFDRMLATQAELDAAKSTPAYDQYFRSQEQSGMTDAEWVKYQKQIKARDSKAQVTLEDKVLKELRERKSREWREEKAPLIQEEIERLSKEPVYQIFSDAVKAPMDRAEFKSFGNIDRIPPNLRNMTVTDGTGISPTEYAENYGYSSVESMIDNMVNAPTLKVAASDAAEQRMIAKHGDILNDGSIELEAAQALHSDAQAEVLLTELRALRKRAGAPEINRDLLKTKARTMIEGMTFRAIKPNKYYQAEIRAAKRAATAQTDREALDAKIQQLANHYMYREAVDVKDRMRRQRQYVKGIQDRKYKTNQVHKDYVANMKALAGLYDLRSNTDRVQSAGNILRWAQDQMEIAGVSLWDQTLILMLEAEQRNKIDDFVIPTFDDLTADHLQGVYDMIRHLRYVGGKMADAAKAELAADRERLRESIINHGGKDVTDVPGIPSDWTTGKRKFFHMVNKLPSLRNMMRKLDGFEELGPAYDLIFREIERGERKKQDLTTEMFMRFKNELNDIHRIGLTKKGGKEYQLENGGTVDLASEHRFMLALYWGTETSREAVREAWGMTDADVTKILSDLTQEQLAVVNATWKLNESMWPELSAAGFEMDGVAPPKLEATPFEVNGIKMTGGHTRLFYDSSRLELKNEQEQAEAYASVMPTKAGSLHARVGSGGAPPDLDVNNITRAINDNIHYIAFAEVSRKVRSVINAPEVKSAIERKHGMGFYRALIESITGVTGNHIERDSIPWIGSMFRVLRRAATFKHLAYSIRNTVQQVSALPVAMEEVGAVSWLNAARKLGPEWLGAMVRLQSPQGQNGTIAFIQDNSTFMRERSSLVNREAAEYLREMKITGKFGHVWKAFERHGFTPQTIIDSLVSYPTWLVRYETAMEDHGDHDIAVSQADIAVSETVGSGSNLHLGGAFQSNNTEWVRTFTLFGTWFNAYYQRMYKATKGGTELANLQIPRAFIVTPFIVAMIEAVLTMNIPADDENWWEWMLKRYGSFMGGTMPLVRDVVSAFQGFAPKTVWSGAAEFPAKTTRLFEQVFKKGEIDIGTASDITKLTTTIVPVPGVGNMTRFMDYMDSYNQGREGEWSTYQAFVKGETRK